MGKVNYQRYDPRKDSSEGAEEYWAEEGSDDPGFYPSQTVILIRPTLEHCPCGCGEKPKGGDRTFAMGHDARYRGKLIRAHVAGFEVAVASDTGLTSGPAMSFAVEHGWGQYLDDAKQREDERRQAKLDRANKALLAKATGPQVGDTRVIRVGRWEHTGQVVAVFDNGAEFEFEYVTKKGETKRITKSKEEVA